MTEIKALQYQKKEKNENNENNAEKLTEKKIRKIIKEEYGKIEKNLDEKFVRNKFIPSNYQYDSTKRFSDIYYSHFSVMKFIKVFCTIPLDEAEFIFKAFRYFSSIYSNTKFLIFSNDDRKEKFLKDKLARTLGGDKIVSKYIELEKEKKIEDLCQKDEVLDRGGIFFGKNYLTKYVYFFVGEFSDKYNYINDCLEWENTLHVFDLQRKRA